MLTREEATKLQHSQLTVTVATLWQIRHDLMMISLARQLLETEVSRDEPNPRTMQNLLAYIAVGEKRLEQKIADIEQGKDGT